MTIRYAILPILLLPAACGEADTGPGDLSADERQQLERAAEMLDSRSDTPATSSPEDPPAPFESE